VKFKFNKYIIIIIILSLALIASVFLVVKTTSFYNRAATSTSSSITLENSYLFASPLQAKADGREQIRITVFLLDGRGLGVPNQPVKLLLPNTITIDKSQNTTDNNGKATFDLSSTTPQKTTITAKNNNQTLPQKIKISFYE
jgi:Big-like domain-containing protein